MLSRRCRLSGCAGALLYAFPTHQNACAMSWARCTTWASSRLENSLRNFSALTQGDVIGLYYNDKTYTLQVLETHPGGQPICIHETDLEVDVSRSALLGRTRTSLSLGGLCAPHRICRTHEVILLYDTQIYRKAAECVSTRAHDTLGGHVASASTH